MAHATKLINFAKMTSTLTDSEIRQEPPNNISCKPNYAMSCMFSKHERHNLQAKLAFKFEIYHMQDLDYG